MDCGYIKWYASWPIPISTLHESTNLNLALTMLATMKNPYKVPSSYIERAGKSIHSHVYFRLKGLGLGYPKQYTIKC